MPVMNEDLEPEPETALEPEPEILPTEVDVHLNASISIADEEFDVYPDNTLGELSQGLTFEQISHAVDVVEGKKSGEKDEYFAGETLSVMPDDFLNMICMQENYEAKVKKLIAGYYNILYFFYQFFPHQLPSRLIIILNSLFQNQTNIFQKILVRHFFGHICEKLFLRRRLIHSIFHVNPITMDNFFRINVQLRQRPIQIEQIATFLTLIQRFEFCAQKFFHLVSGNMTLP